MKFKEVKKDDRVKTGYYRRGTESYIDWLKVLVERLAPYNVEIKKITEWQYRINGVLDLYPVNRRYHNIKTGRRGDYRDFVSFTVKYFNLKSNDQERDKNSGKNINGNGRASGYDTAGAKNWEVDARG